MNSKILLSKLVASFPNSNTTPETVLVYAERLSTIPLHELEVVINQAIDTCEFLPTIAKLKEIHRQLHSPVSPDRAAAGWRAVQRAFSDPTTYTPDPTSCAPQFDDPIVRKTVEAMGWHSLRLSENTRTDQAQFERLYRMFVEQDANEQRLTPEYKQLRDQYTEQRTDKGSGLLRIDDVLKLKGSDN